MYLILIGLDEYLGYLYKYLTGAGIIALVGHYIKQSRDVMFNKRRIDQLEQQRKDDLIEFNTSIGLAKGWDAKMDAKIEKVMHTFSDQRHEDMRRQAELREKDLQQRRVENEETRKIMSSLGETLVKLNTTLEFIREDVKELKDKS